MMYFGEVLGDSVAFNSSEEIVCYSMPYFKTLGRLIKNTDKR